VKRKLIRCHKTPEDVQAITDKWIDANEHGYWTYEDTYFWWNKKHPDNLVSAAAIGKYCKYYKEKKEYFVPGMVALRSSTESSATCSA
jgi:hypothetical protein